LKIAKYKRAAVYDGWRVDYAAGGANYHMLVSCS
jgi:hypothetical protein